MSVVLLLRTNYIKVEIMMGKYLIAMTSITYAMKAKALLNESRLYCEIQRTPENIGSGCGYSLRIRDDPDKIIAFLDSFNIPHKDAYEYE